MPKVWEEYVSAIEPGEIVSRAMMAHRMGVHKNTATFHLERAVGEGALNKGFGWTGRQGGWVYARPDTMPRMV
jgi:predicted ArsR family transcriptional regulator